jgi:minor histocompatibility antigen H13
MLVNAAKSILGKPRWRKLSHLTLTLHHNTDKLLALKYPTLSIFFIPLAIYPSVVYLFFPDIMDSQHTVLIDIMSLSLCYTGLSTIKIDSWMTGCVLLSGLFFYDIWWVFGSKPVFGSSVVGSGSFSLEVTLDFLIYPTDGDSGSRLGCSHQDTMAKV